MGASVAAALAAWWPFASSVAGEADEFASSGPQLTEGAEC